MNEIEAVKDQEMETCPWKKRKMEIAYNQKSKMHSCWTPKDDLTNKEY